MLRRLDERLFSALESELEETPDFFILNCALSMTHGELIIKEIPCRDVTIMPYWFNFPLELFLNSPPDLQQRLGHFIARNAIRLESEIHAVLCAAAFSAVHADRGLLYLLLHCFADAARDPSTVAFVFAYMIAFVFLRVGPAANQCSPGLLAAFRVSPFGACEEPEPTEAEGLKFSFGVRIANSAMRDSTVIKEANSLLAGIPEDVVPDLHKCPMNCVAIYSAVSKFPMHGRTDLTPEEVARFDKTMMWLLTAVNRHLHVGLESRKLSLARRLTINHCTVTERAGTLGRMRGPLSVSKKCTSVRDPFLTQFCPFLFRRVKKQTPVPRLLVAQESAPRIAGHATRVVFNARRSVKVSFKEKGLNVRSPGGSRQSLLYVEITDIIAMKNHSVHVVAD
jgi:hypothetical protein